MQQAIFSRYVGLYTLHQIETTGDLLVLRVRVETLRYSFAPLRALPLDDAYAVDPASGAALVRETVLPRLHTLLESGDPFAALGIGDGDTAWQQYASVRGLPAEPVTVPQMHAPAMPHLLPARSRTSERLARIQQGLEVVRTVAETASTLSALWQNWRIGQQRQQLLADQRELLHNAIQAQLTGQQIALDHAQDRDYVRGYLRAHGDDPAYEDLELP